MKDPASDLSDYFRAERERDLREAPSFESLATVDGPRVRIRPAWRPKLTVMTLAVAAAVAAFLISPRFGSPDASFVEFDQGGAMTTDLDELCDAALAALDEHEADVLMVTPTDAFLPLGQ